MPWLLTLHIAALIGWCGALLYLPGLLVSQHASGSRSRSTQPYLPLWVYTTVATPVALAAIILGTLVFTFYGILDEWLVLKLVLVTALVILHLLTGLLMVRCRQGRIGKPHLWCYLQSALTASVITAILWLVLAKPLAEV
ncbi:CopD family protein [Gilvimarinus algae]|uniref:Protoporphyrinogen IX oxidase n=1 Tax=Gilvimarinus algae TaxID=3058037 RepID=A0ABT8TIH7_9GAMM|nr:CopD family protein [Gilvimarinus sp. SDUM040014]MDO3383736.1 CopD family protein [Gilvimarinus sp. SDUM040014]